MARLGGEARDLLFSFRFSLLCPISIGIYPDLLGEAGPFFCLPRLFLTLSHAATIVPPTRHFGNRALSQDGEKTHIVQRSRETFVAIGDTGLTARIEREASATNQFKTFLSRYFYFCMSLVLAALVVVGFSRTVNVALFHANPPRPLLLWMHGAAFSTWIVFFIAQSSLVRVRKVSVHRALGWFGAGLAAVMVVLGFAIAVVMTRFDILVLHQKGVDSFLSVPFGDMIVFGSCVGAAINFRKKPAYHRPLLFIATCHLMDAAVGRFDFIFNHSLFYLAVDGLIALGMMRDRVVDGRVHKVYLYALPAIIVVQTFAIYTWRVNPAWWAAITHAILGL